MSNEMMNLSENNRSFVSFEAESLADKKKLYNAMTAPDARLGEHINEIIKISQVFAEFVEVVDEETGELATVPRVVLFDENDKSYVSVSKGIYNAVKNILLVFGPPQEWEKPLAVKVKQVTIKKGSMLTLEIIG